MSNEALSLARNTIAIEVDALHAMSMRLSQSFEHAVDCILSARGRVVIIGMGKSGLIGQKIAATLASTGTPSFYVHPGEAYHGDLGMLKPSDVAVLISKSGETEEVIRLLPFLQHQKNQVIAVTGRLDSTLARNSDIVLDVAVEREACINNIAPTSSTTATLVMGDALAVALTHARKFKPEDFAKFHPGGSLGKKLLNRVRDVMRTDNLPICQPDTNFAEVVQIINRGRLGVAIVQNNEKLLGIITDGDVRRAFDSDNDLKSIKAHTIMTKQPKTIPPNDRLIEAEETMRLNRINSLIVTDASKKCIGIVQIFDLE